MFVLDTVVYVYAGLALAYFIVSPGARSEFHSWVAQGWNFVKNKYFK